MQVERKFDDCPNQKDVQDIKNMVIDLIHNVSQANITPSLLVDKVSALKFKVESVRDTQGTVVDSATNFNADNSSTNEWSPSSTHTRHVSSTVYACIIMSE